LAKNRHVNARTLAARGAEIFAAGEQFAAMQAAARDACGLDQAEDDLEAAEDEAADLEREALLTPAGGATGFAVKLIMFKQIWRSRENDDAAIKLGVIVAVELAALVERAQEPAQDPDVDAFRPLGEIAARIVGEFATREETAFAEQRQ
jgi:hypothetical protein